MDAVNQWRLVAAQHLEGGPQAQLCLLTRETKLEMFGSYETSFREDDNSAMAWPVPNILGVRPRAAKSDEPARRIAAEKVLPELKSNCV